VDWQRFGVKDAAGHYEPGRTIAPMHLKQVQVITFDLDNTLWEIQPVIERAERELHQFLSQRYPAMTQDMPLSAMSELRDQVSRAHPDKEHDFTFLRKQQLCERARQVAFDPEQANTIAEEAFSVFYRYRNEVRLYDDVIPALEWLHARYRLMSISNGNADLQAIGIAHYFASSVWAREVGTLKPGALMYLRAVIDVRINPEYFLHVGDDPVMDVAGARAVGYQTAWLDRFDTPWPNDQEPADMQFKSLTQLVELLKETGSTPVHTLT
jgi:FMN hydrolase / 5-amino-6-(5-phospho-D-ribitylamino)uracil phosphatase